MYSVRIFVELWAIVNEGFLGFPQPLKADVKIVLWLEYNSSSRLFILQILTMSQNNPQKMLRRVVSPQFFILSPTFSGEIFFF
jgi:hypothetical protein